MKKTTKKLSLGMKISAILACLALVSVGFASWWIVQMPDPVVNSDGSFTVYSVDTKNVKIENLEFATTDAGVSSANIIFGKTTGVTERWLVAEDVDDQNLTATFTFDVNLYDNYKENEQNDLGTGAINDYISEITLDFVPTGIDSAISAGYITAPVIAYTYGEGENVSTGNIDYGTSSEALSIDMSGATSNTVEVTVTITFAWGEAFENQNPYAYFNAKNPNENSTVLKPDSDDEYLTWAAYASNALGGLKALESASYSVTLTAQMPA